MFNFAIDAVIKDKAYPALARWPGKPYTQSWREFGQHYPFTVPADLFDFCKYHNFPFCFYTVDEKFPADSFYVISLSFFDFSIDYISLLSDKVKKHIQDKKLTLLFYYDEGDNPYIIKQHLDLLCTKNSLSKSCYKFVSANTRADEIPGFAYFAADELLFLLRNKDIEPVEQSATQRRYQFTMLSRTHKWWRATVAADMHAMGLLDHSQWSYNTVDINDSAEDNPIEIDQFTCLRTNMQLFLDGAPYTCDHLTEFDHNNHHMTELGHYTDSYCNIVLETHFDADGSGGAFLTEKTFKPIKFGQPFVIVGCAGSLRALRQLGYKTFDHAIDNSYDNVVNNTDRWTRCRDTIAQIKKQDLHTWFESCRADALHNQQLFAATKFDRLNTLLKRLQHT